jgi:hypothetical protein
MENAFRALVAESMANAHAVQPDDPHLRLVLPLISKRTLSRNVTVLGNRAETHIAVESVASNGVKHVTDALLRENKTAEAIERVLTIHTQMFASQRDSIPASTDLRTIIVDHVKRTPELDGQWYEIFITVVDKSGVHRSPVARAKVLY